MLKRTYKHTVDGIRYVVGPPYSFGKPTTEDLAAIRLLAEQVAVPADQLSAFTGRPLPHAIALANRLSTHGWTQLARFPGDEHEWMWLRSGGVLRSGLPFGYHHPRATSLDHRRRINDARLKLEAEFPDGTWICERSIRLRAGNTRLPDAAFARDGSMWAIEVELSSRYQARIRKALDELLEDYDEVLSFCSPTILPLLERLSKGYGGRVKARLSGVEPPSVRGVRHRGRPVGEYHPTPLEKEALMLISEEGSIAAEQLASLLNHNIDAAKKVIEDLFHATAIRAACGDGVNSGWIFCNHRGSRVAGLGLYPVLGEPRASRFVKRELLTDARIQLRQRFPNGRWFGPRMLQSTHVIPEPFPQAMLEDEQRQYAVEIVTGPWRHARTRDRISRHVNRLDGVICVCAKDVLANVRELIEHREWDNVQTQRFEKR